MEASSLALEPWMGISSILAALVPPKQKKESATDAALSVGDQ